VEVKIDALPLHPDTYTLDIGCRLGEFGFWPVRRRRTLLIITLSPTCASTGGWGFSEFPLRVNHLSGDAASLPLSRG
jgi:hypothetical protein